MEKIKAFYALYSAGLWKTFRLGKTAEKTGCEQGQRSADDKTFLQKLRRERGRGRDVKKIWKGKTNPFILLVLQGGLCYTLLWITINEDHRGAAAVWELQPCPWGRVPQSGRSPG